MEECSRKQAEECSREKENERMRNRDQTSWKLTKRAEEEHGSRCCKDSQGDVCHGDGAVHLSDRSGSGRRKKKKKKIGEDKFCLYVFFELLQTPMELSEASLWFVGSGWSV